jgi:hypothetical protein
MASSHVHTRYANENEMSIPRTRAREVTTVNAILTLLESLVKMAIAAKARKP